MLSQPVGQVRLTNVALVKYKIGNKRFEVAAYKNKVLNWRNGVEKDIDEVVQSHNIFSNTSKGELASKDLLNKYFPDMNNNQILSLIIDKGELQEGELEREAQSDHLFKEIINWISSNCVHPDSKRPFSQESIKSALKGINYKIKLDQTSKRQALFALKMLSKKFHIIRAEMQVQIIGNLNEQEKQLYSLIYGF